MLGFLLLGSMLALLKGEPKDTDKVINFYNDGSKPVTMTIEGMAPVKLAAHEAAERRISDFGSYIVTLDNGSGITHSRRFVLGDEGAFYVAPKTLNWCVVARNSALNLDGRQECHLRLKH